MNTRDLADPNAFCASTSHCLQPSPNSPMGMSTAVMPRTSSANPSIGPELQVSTSSVRCAATQPEGQPSIPVHVAGMCPACQYLVVMPEGNVIHFHARKLSRAFRHTAVAVDSPQGRFADGAARVDGCTLVRTEAYGKHLFLEFGPQSWVHVHLGLFGKWRFGTQGLIRMRLRNDKGYAELRGPTACAVLDGAEMQTQVNRIGPDPIRKDSDPERAWVRLQRSDAPIAAALMDQRTFAGVGNIYRAEVLFRHDISPFRTSRSITRDEFDAMWQDLVGLMTAGTKRGRIDTVRAEHLPEVMGREARKDRHGGEVYVYRRAGQKCLLCGTPVEMMDLQGRKLYWCPSCQRG